MLQKKNTDTSVSRNATG